jgi:hypothetical protein
MAYHELYMKFKGKILPLVVELRRDMWSYLSCIVPHKGQKQLIPQVPVFFLSVLWCSQIGNNPYKNLAKFGYKFNMKIIL